GGEPLSFKEGHRHVRVADVDRKQHGRTLPWQGRGVAFAPEEEVGGLPPNRPGPGRHTTRMRPTGQVALRDRRLRIPWGDKCAVPNLPPDLLVRAAERGALANQLFRSVGGDQRRGGDGGVDALAVEPE